MSWRRRWRRSRGIASSVRRQSQHRQLWTTTMRRGGPSSGAAGQHEQALGQTHGGCSNKKAAPKGGFLKSAEEKARRIRSCSALGWPGSDLLSRVLRRSIIGAEEFNGRVRNGIGCLSPRNCHQTSEAQICKNKTNNTGRSSVAHAGTENESDQAKRAISTGKLNALPRFHTRPINVVVFHGS